MWEQTSSDRHTDGGAAAPRQEELRCNWMRVLLICSALESHGLAALQPSVRLFVSFCHSAHTDTHTKAHTHAFGRLSAVSTIPLDSHNAINLKQTKFRGTIWWPLNKLRQLTFQSRSLRKDKHSATGHQCPLELLHGQVQMVDSKRLGKSRPDILKKIFTHGSELCIQICHRFEKMLCRFAS